MNQRNRMLFAVLVFLVICSNFVFACAADGTSGTSCSDCDSSKRLICAMKQICYLFEGLLPILAFVLFILAGVAYAVGNFFGAEMRAKAIGYAMNMLTGAIIGLILSIIGPSLLSALSGTTGLTAAGTGCARIIV